MSMFEHPGEWTPEEQEAGIRFARQRSDQSLYNVLFGMAASGLITITAINAGLFESNRLLYSGLPAASALGALGVWQHLNRQSNAEQNRLLGVVIDSFNNTGPTY